MNPSTVYTRFAIISDTHDTDMQFCLPPVDILLHCGDLTQCGGHKNFEKALEMMGNVDAKLKLVIAGNHDLELDETNWSCEDDPSDHAKAVDIMKGPKAEAAGVTYLEEGTHTFTLDSGARLTVYTSPYTPAYGDFAFMYEDEDRFNPPSAPNPIPNFPSVDIIMTHGPPMNILDEIPTGAIGCPMLLQGLRRARPLMHCFGHVHEGHGARLIRWEGNEIVHSSPVLHDRGEWKGKGCERIDMTASDRGETLMVNAAIQDAEGGFTNPAWIVDLTLRGAEAE